MHRRFSQSGLGGVCCVHPLQSGRHGTTVGQPSRIWHLTFRCQTASTPTRHRKGNHSFRRCAGEQLRPTYNDRYDHHPGKQHRYRPSQAWQAGTDLRPNHHHPSEGHAGLHPVPPAESVIGGPEASPPTMSWMRPQPHRYAGRHSPTTSIASDPQSYHATSPDQFRLVRE